MNDLEIKNRITAILTQAATEAGTLPTATEGAKKGALTASSIRSLLGNGVLLSTTERLLNELVDATTIVRNMNNSPDTAKWTYSAA